MLTVLTLFTTLSILVERAFAQTTPTTTAPPADSPASSAPAVDCTTDEGVSKYISCQKSKFSTTQLVIGGIGVVLALFLVGFGIVWFLNRKKRQNVEDGGETGKKTGIKKQAEKEEYSDDSDDDEEEDRREKPRGVRKESSDEDSDEESEEEKARPPPTRQPQLPSRQQQQSRPKQESQSRPQAKSPPVTSRPPTKEVSPQARKPSATPPKSRVAKVETESEEEDDSSEEETDTDDSEEEEKPKPKPAPKPEIKKPQAVVQRIPRTESPEVLTDEGSPVDRRSSRQLYASNPSPNPRHLQRVSSDLGSSTPIAIPQSGRSRQGDIPSSSPSQRAAPRSRESTMPLNVRKGSSNTVRQPSFYEPSSRPIRSSPAEGAEPPRRPSVPRMASDAGVDKSKSMRRPSEGQSSEKRRPSEASSKEGGRKGSSGSRKAERI